MDNNSHNSADRSLWILALASAGGLGYFPVASGTVGSLAGVLMYLFVWRWPWWLFFISLAALFFLGVYVSDRCQEMLRKKDPGIVVIDEVVGMLLTCFSFPLTWKYLLAGFLLFRFFDIVKIFPARHIDRTWTSGYGVMTDDVFAGLYANLCLQLVRYLGWL